MTSGFRRIIPSGRHGRAVRRQVPELVLPLPVDEMAWFALVTRPQGEAMAERLLRDLGLAAFNPVHSVRQTVRRGARTAVVRLRRAVMTSTILLGAAPVAHELGSVPEWRGQGVTVPAHKRRRPVVAVDWERVFSVAAVCGVVGVAGRPATIPAHAVVRLMNLSGENARVRRLPPVGARARLVGTALADYEGRVVEIRDLSAGIRMTLDLDNGLGTVEVDAEAVERVEG